MLQETVSDGFVKRLFSNLNWQVFLKSYKKKRKATKLTTVVFFFSSGVIWSRHGPPR